MRKATVSWSQIHTTVQRTSSAFFLCSLIACASSLTCATPDDEIKKATKLKNKLIEEVNWFSARGVT